MSGNPPPESSGSQNRTILSALAVATLVVIGLVVAWVAWGQWQNARPVSFNVRLYGAPAATPSSHPVASSPALPVPTPIPPPDTDDAAAIIPPRLELQSGKLPWEMQLETLLRSNQRDREKALRLLKQLGSAPPEAFTRLTEEAVARLPDHDYGTVLPLLLNPDTHGAVEAVLFDDLLERPDAITLPALLSITRTPRHPFADTAREALIALVGADHGTDWNQWNTAVAKLLAAEEQK